MGRRDPHGHRAMRIEECRTRYRQRGKDNSIKFGGGRHTADREEREREVAEEKRRIAEELRMREEKALAQAAVREAELAKVGVRGSMSGEAGGNEVEQGL